MCVYLGQRTSLSSKHKQQTERQIERQTPAEHSQSPRTAPTHARQPHAGRLPTDIYLLLPQRIPAPGLTSPDIVHRSAEPVPLVQRWSPREKTSIGRPRPRKKCPVARGRLSPAAGRKSVRRLGGWAGKRPLKGSRRRKKNVHT